MSLEQRTSVGEAMKGSVGDYVIVFLILSATQDDGAPLRAFLSPLALRLHSELDS